MPGTLEDYEVLGPIGSGTYGTCKKVIRKRDGKVFVWKEINYGHMSEREKMMIVSEVNLLRELKHENIVRYYERVVDKSTATIFIIMEYCEGGDLASLIRETKNHRSFIEEDFIWQVCHQAVLAMSVLHGPTEKRKSVLHRDLKPANIFLDSQLNIKIGDFGMARVLNNEASFAKSFVGTPFYMSPEQMTHDLYDEKSDIWSLGCVLYELCSLNPPFNGSNHFDLARNITNGAFSRIPEHYSDKLQNLIASMLQTESDKRPSIEDLLATFAAMSSGRRQSRRKSDDLRQEKLNARETSIKEKEATLRQKETNLLAREKALEEKEKEVKAKQKALEIKESLCNAKLARAEKIISSQRRPSKLDAENRPPRKVSSSHEKVSARGSETMTALRHAIKRGVLKTIKTQKIQIPKRNTESSRKNAPELNMLEFVKLTCEQLERRGIQNSSVQCRLQRIKERSREFRKHQVEYSYHNRQILAQI